MLATSLLLVAVHGISPGCVDRYQTTRHSECNFEFNGVVVDQDGNPVPGVRIETDTSQYGAALLAFPRAFLMKPGPHDQETETSDKHGRFRFRGRGYLFQVKVEKTGYEFAPLPYSFHLSRWFSSDPPALPKTAKHEVFWQDFINQGAAEPVQVSRDEPYVIRAWKKGEPVFLIETLGDQDALLEVEGDGRFHTIDLLRIGAGRLRPAGEGGDLRVSLRPVAPQPPDKPDRWQLKIEAMDGGVTETQDVFMYRAPTEGYQPWAEVEVSRADHRFPKFYFTSRGGAVHGRFDVALRLSSRAGLIGLQLRYAVNPDGSTNLLGGGPRQAQFFGHVLDQTGAPVTDQPIQAKVDRAELNQVSQLATDDEGRFVFRGPVVDLLSLRLSRRNGYDVPKASLLKVKPCSQTDDVAIALPGHQVFWEPLPWDRAKLQSTYRGILEPCRLLQVSAAHPYVIPVWHFGAPTSLTRVDEKVDFAQSLGTETITLLAGTPADRGDLRFTLTTQPAGKDGLKPWSLRVEAPDGGIQRVSGPFTYEAPEGGYVSADQVRFSVGRASYFARLRHGAAHAVFTLTAYGQDALEAIRIQGWTNPTSDRNLTSTERLAEAATDRQ